MKYKVEFEIDGDSVSYTVKADNVLDAEELAKEKLKKDKSIREKAYRGGHSVSAWKVKHIENFVL